MVERKIMENKYIGILGKRNFLATEMMESGGLYLEIHSGDSMINVVLPAETVQKFLKETCNVKTTEPPYEPQVGDWVEIVRLRNTDSRLDGLIRVGGRYIVMGIDDAGRPLIDVAPEAIHYVIHDKTQLKKVELPKEGDDDQSIGWRGNKN